MQPDFRLDSGFFYRMGLGKLPPQNPSFADAQSNSPWLCLFAFGYTLGVEYRMALKYLNPTNVLDPGFGSVGSV